MTIKTSFHGYLTNPLRLSTRQSLFKTTRIEFFPIIVLGFKIICEFVLQNFNNYSRAPSMVDQSSFFDVVVVVVGEISMLEGGCFTRLWGMDVPNAMI